MSATAATIGFIKDIRARNVKAVRERLQRAKERPNQRFLDPSAAGTSYSLLHQAVDSRCCAAADLLIAAGADVDARDAPHGATPLHWAAARADNDGDMCGIAAALIAAKAQLEARDTTDGATPLHTAAAHGNVALMRVLIAAGASTSAVDNHGGSPAHAAARRGAMAALEELIAAVDAAPAASDGGGGEPAAGAAAAGAAVGGCLGRQDAAGRTPLLLLLRGGHASLALSLMERHAGAACAINAQEADGGSTALSLAVAGSVGNGVAGLRAATAAAVAAEEDEQRSRLVGALLAAGASPDARDSRTGDTVLASAIRCGKLSIAAQLLPFATGIQSDTGAMALLLPRITDEIRGGGGGGGGDAGVAVAAVATTTTAASTAAAGGSGEEEEKQQQAAAVPSSAAAAAPTRSVGGSVGLLRAVPRKAAASLQPPSAAAKVRQSSSSGSGSSSSSIRAAATTTTSSKSGTSNISARRLSGERKPAAAAKTVRGDAAVAPVAAAPTVTAAASPQQPAAPPPPQPSAQDVAVALLRRGAQMAPADAASLLQTAWAAGRDELCALALGALPPFLSSPDPPPGAQPPSWAECRGRAGMSRTAAAALVREARAAGADWRGPQGGPLGDSTHLMLAAAEPGDANGPLCAALCGGEALIPVDAANSEGDTALFLAARAGNVAVCRALIEECGADPLHRNARNRTAATQLRLPEAARAYLARAEADAKAARARRVRSWFDPAMAAAQTASACIVQTV